MQSNVPAGGCFWGVQGVFEYLSGVQRVILGYAGRALRRAVRDCERQ